MAKKIHLTATRHQFILCMPVYRSLWHVDLLIRTITVNPRSHIDFDIRIINAGSHFQVAVTEAPGGRASSLFEFPLSALELENLILRISTNQNRVRRANSVAEQSARTLGDILFESIFQGSVADCLSASLVEARNRESVLRIRLNLQDAPELLNVPWEFLRHSGRHQFLALSSWTPIVRCLDIPIAHSSRAIAGPLRVLVVISAPSDFPKLDTDDEWKSMRSTLEKLERQGLVQVTRLEKPLVGSLQSRLRQEEFHVLHFIGHGAYDPTTEDGMLLFEDEQGNSRPVSSDHFATLLHDHLSLRLVILNTCEGARTSRYDPFAGVAQRLIQSGIPAAVAMQFQISDDAARKFSKSLYGALTDNVPIDVAVSEARKSMYVEENDVEWATPVLYLGASDGVLFRIQPNEQDAKRYAQANHLYESAVQEIQYEEWSSAIAKFDRVSELNPNFPGLRESRQFAERQRRLSSEYRTALEFYSSGELNAAKQLLMEIESSLPGYRNVAELLKSIHVRQTKIATDVSEKESGQSGSKWNIAKSQLAAVILVALLTALLVRFLPDLPQLIPIAATAPQVSEDASSITPATMTGEYSPVEGMVWHNPKDDANYVYIPPGSFFMGSDEQNVAAQSDEWPQHRISLGGYRIMKTEVTNKQYSKCVEFGPCDEPFNDRWNVDEYSDHPVTNVTWHMASQYAEWVGGRLPTEAEWEKAACGDDSRVYPWGSTPPTHDKANFGRPLDHPNPVYAHPGGVSPYGLLNMSGNVFEWTYSEYKNYPYDPFDGREHPGNKKRVYRGGSYFNDPAQLRCAARFYASEQYEMFDVGFRVVVPVS